MSAQVPSQSATKHVAPAIAGAHAASRWIPAFAGTTGRVTWHRLALWSVLLLFALFFLTPMYVMLTTSL
jgi:hypothetical protein